MLEVWYVLKFSYVAEDNSSHVGMLAYEHLGEAKELFNELQLSYRFNLPIRIKGERMVTVTSAWLFESFRYLYSDALKAVNMGEATVMYHTDGIDVDLQKATRLARAES